MAATSCARSRPMIEPRRSPSSCTAGPARTKTDCRYSSSGAEDYFEKGYDLTLLFRRIAYTLALASSGTYATGPPVSAKKSG